jgi:hypothetical protein
MNISIPMHPKNSGIHDGHKMIINYAKQFGNPIVVIYKLKEYDKNIDITNQIQSLDDFGIPSRVIEVLPISKKKKKKISSIVNYIVNLYKDQLILPRNIDRAKQSIERFYYRKKIFNKSTILYGPEPIHFFYKSFSELTTSNKNLICPYIIKPENSIKYQALTFKLEPEQQEMFLSIKKLLNESKYLYKRGNNIKLVNELNDAYKKPKFNIEDITVYEGGIFEGRLEVVGLHFHREDGGSVLLEEIDYFI